MRQTAVVAILVLAAPALRAGPISFSGSVGGGFASTVEPSGAGASLVYIPEYGPFYFGSPASVLTFQGTDFDTAVGEPFLLGTFGFFNATNMSSVESAALELLFEFAGGASDPFAATVPLSIANSPNITGNPALDADFIGTDVGLLPGAVFGDEGQEYWLFIDGFLTDDGETSILSPILGAAEGQMVTAKLYGEFLAVPTAETPPGETPAESPEPATFVLLGFGGLSLLATRRRK